MGFRNLALLKLPLYEIILCKFGVFSLCDLPGRSVS